jgi:hypothetical protein
MHPIELNLPLSYRVLPSTTSWGGALLATRLDRPGASCRSLCPVCSSPRETNKEETNEGMPRGPSPTPASPTEVHIGDVSGRKRTRWAHGWSSSPATAATCVPGSQLGHSSHRRGQKVGMANLRGGALELKVKSIWFKRMKRGRQGTCCQPTLISTVCNSTPRYYGAHQAGLHGACCRSEA